MLSLAWVFARRDVAIARAYPIAFVFQMVASAGMLLVVNRVGLLVDSQRSSDEAMRAGYFSYVLVGVVVLQFVTATVVSFSTKLRQEQTTGTLEAMLSTPTPPARIALCLATYEVVRGVAGSVVLLVGGVVLAGARLDATPASTLTSVLSFAGLLFLGGSAGVVVAALVVVLRRGGGLAGWVVAAVAFFSGVYFPVGNLPVATRWLGEALPFSWGLTALRSGLLLGQTDTGRALGTLAAGGVCLALSLVAFTVATDVARRRGTLASY